jgi:hypothetical protein
MFTQKRTLIVIGAVVLALGLVAPASAKPELPEGYKLPAAEPGVWAPMAVLGEALAANLEKSTGYTPQALRAMGLRGEAMAAYFEKSTGYTPQALQALGERGEAMNAYYLGSGIGRPSPDVIQSPTRDVIGIDAVGRTAPTLAAPVADESFDWNTVGVVGGSALFLVALAIGGLVGVRTRGRVAHS